MTETVPATQAADPTRPGGPASPEDQLSPTRHESLKRDAWRSLRRNPTFLVASVLVLVVGSMAAFPRLWTSTDPFECDLANSRGGPTSGHIFGFTVQGCDMYAQAVYGARPSVVIAMVCTAGTFVIGVVLGTLAAYYGGFIDTIVSRVADVVLGLPFLLGGILFLSMVGLHSIWSISAVLIVLGWGPMTRVMRGSALSVIKLDFVSAARGMGASDFRIITKHVLPNALAPTFVIATIALGQFVAAEATLTFLGVGLQLPDTSWGILVAGGRSWALAGSPLLLAVPCAFLIVTVLGFILMGDALRDALDPKLK